LVIIWIAEVPAAGSAKGEPGMGLWKFAKPVTLRLPVIVTFENVAVCVDVVKNIVASDANAPVEELRNWISLELPDAVPPPAPPPQPSTPASTKFPLASMLTQWPLVSVPVVVASFEVEPL
jgi:hypothetical protein